MLLQPENFFWGFQSPFISSKASLPCILEPCGQKCPIFFSNSDSHCFQRPCVSWLCITGAPAFSLATPGTAGAPNWDELHKLMMKAPCSQGNSAPSLGKQSRSQRAKLGRDPARNGEKSSNSLAIHLMETYPANRTFRNENSLYLLLFRAMSTANFSRLQGDRSTQTVPPSAPGMGQGHCSYHPHPTDRQLHTLGLLTARHTSLF